MQYIKMKKRILYLTASLFYSLSALLFHSCEDDYTPTYENYGLVHKKASQSLSISLDNGKLLYPKESWVNPEYLTDSMRLFLHFNILEETDSCTHIRMTYADSVLTKPILQYDNTESDSIGNDPVKITKAWITHGFINLEFIFAGGEHLSNQNAHLVNLVQYPSGNNQLILEFHHNDFQDSRDRVYFGTVSFPLTSLTGKPTPPFTLQIKFKDSSLTTNTIELTHP